MIGNTEARTSLRLVLRASFGVAVLGVSVAGLAQILERFAVTSGGGFVGKGTVFVLSLAAGLFVAAGVLRLAKWRLARDAYSALAGSALMVMGGLCLPLGGFARLVTTTDGLLVGPAIRCLASFIAMYLVLQALRATTAAHGEHPGRVLPRVFGFVTVVFLLLVVIVRLFPPMGGRALFVLTVVLSTAMALGWFGLTVHAAAQGDLVPWARRASPLFLGMGLAETMRGLDLGRSDEWTFAGVLLCAFVAAVATRYALIDLDAAVHAQETHRTQLSTALDRASGEAGELTVWREQLTHDARNACAGLRAAMEILERYDGRVDASITERLRLAALQEIGQIEHLITRSSTQACQPFEVSEVVHTIGEAARSLGARVRVHGDRVHGTGRAADLAAVLKNILVNAQTHAPGSRVDIRVSADADTVTIACSDDGPGLRNADTARVFERGYRQDTSPGSGLGLYAARELMREQDGDLTIGPPRPGATFLITLPAAPVPASPAVLVRVPGHRTAPPTSSRRLPLTSSKSDCA